MEVAEVDNKSKWWVEEVHLPIQSYQSILDDPGSYLLRRDLQDLFLSWCCRCIRTLLDLLSEIVNSSSIFKKILGRSCTFHFQEQKKASYQIAEANQKARTSLQANQALQKEEGKLQAAFNSITLVCNNEHISSGLL